MDRTLPDVKEAVALRIMCFGPEPAGQKLLARLCPAQKDFDVIDRNKAFTAQGLATRHALGIAEDETCATPNGAAIALRRPLCTSGARLALAGGKRSLSMLCVGQDQGIPIALERV